MTMIDNEWQMFLNTQQSNEGSGDTMNLWKLTNNSSVYSSNNNDSLSEEDDDDDDQITSSSCTGKIQKNAKSAKSAKSTNIINSEMKNKNNTTVHEPSFSETNTISVAPVIAPASMIGGPGLCEELYISTQTKIFFLNQSNLDVQKIFWNTKVIPYSCATNGVIKKQIRLISKTKEEFQEYEKKRELEIYFTEKIMKQIDNSNARKIKFKDVRKLTVGVSKKDIMNCHGKNKNAFINCFAIILRVEQNKIFHEIHVKVFNTGRMAIPGIVNDELLESTKILLLDILQPNFDDKIELISEEESPEVFRLVKGKKNKETNKKEKSHFEKVKAKSNVLINSNFNCGFYIHQEKLRTVLRNKYKLNPTYDPSMYPGVKCKFYYNNNLPEDHSVQFGHLEESDQEVTMTELDELVLEKYTKVSFMIFRTGNCLIVGNCTKQILNYVYEFVKNILTTEYLIIRANQDVPVAKIKKHKPRKKMVKFTQNYYQNLFNHEKSI